MYRVSRSVSLYVLIISPSLVSQNYENIGVPHLDPTPNDHLNM